MCVEIPPGFQHRKVCYRRDGKSVFDSLDIHRAEIQTNETSADQLLRNCRLERLLPNMSNLQFHKWTYDCDASRIFIDKITLLMIFISITSTTTILFLMPRGFLCLISNSAQTNRIMLSSCCQTRSEYQQQQGAWHLSSYTHVVLVWPFQPRNVTPRALQQPQDRECETRKLKRKQGETGRPPMDAVVTPATKWRNAL